MKATATRASGDGRSAGLRGGEWFDRADGGCRERSAADARAPRGEDMRMPRRVRKPAEGGAIAARQTVGRRRRRSVVLVRDVSDRIQRKTEQHGGEHNSQPMRRTAGEFKDRHGWERGGNNRRLRLAGPMCKESELSRGRETFSPPDPWSIIIRTFLPQRIAPRVLKTSIVAALTRLPLRSTPAHQ
jgi:hypothetical protein